MASRRSEVTNDRRRFHEISTPEGRLGFGPFVLDPESGRLIEGDRVVPLAPKPFETLAYIAHHAGRVVSKGELMEALWPGTFVTDDVLVQCVVDIRRALGDTAKAPQYVQTIPRRGYQFLARTRAVTQTPEEVRPEPALVQPALPRPPEPGPERASRGPVALAVVAALVVGSLAAWVWHRGGRSAGPWPAEPGSLVVMPVTVEEAAPQSGWLRHGLAEMIRSQLGQTPGVDVVARHRLAAALAEAGFDEQGRAPSPTAAAEVARKLRAQRMVTGSFVRVEDRFVITAEVIDVGTGRTSATASARGQHPGDILDRVEEVSLKLANALRPASHPEASWRPARLPTQSIEAYRRYVEALGWFAKGGRQGAEEAERLLDEAVRLDPSFALASLRKAQVLNWRRQWGYGNPDPAPAVQAAARLARDLPERERFLVRSFEALLVRSDTAGAINEWKAILRIYPAHAEEVGIPGLLADAYLHQGRWDDLIAVGEAHVDSPSVLDRDKAWLSSLMSVAFRRKGELERALVHARGAVRLWPSREGPRFLTQRTEMGRLCLEAGMREEALAEFRAVSLAQDADVTNLTGAAWGLYMAGESAEAEALVERAIALDPAYGNAHHLRGWLRLAAGDYAAAASSLETAFERTPRSFGNPHQGNANGDLAALYYAGVAYQKLERSAQAERVWLRLMERCRKLGETSSQTLDSPQWQARNFLARAAARLRLPAAEPPRLEEDDTTYFVQSARLHAVEGRREQALRELAKGIALGHGELRHIRDDPDFESLRGGPEFGTLVGPSGRPPPRGGSPTSAAGA